jgi:membrane protein DedA with SNARE-associated domain
MFSDLVAQIAPFIQHYGAWAVLVVAIMEEIIAPIPSTFSFLAAGFFLLPEGESLGYVAAKSIFLIVIPGGLGFAIGSLFMYSIAFLGGEPLVRRWGKWFGITWGDVTKLNKYFRGHWTDELLLFGLRAFPLAPSGLVSVMCGILRYPVKKLFIITFLGNCVKAFFLAILGWSLGEAFIIYADQISEFGNYTLYGIGVVAGVVFLTLFVRKKLKKRRLEANK